MFAPELFLEGERAGYGCSVDWWGLGALFGEMLLGGPAIRNLGEDKQVWVNAFDRGAHLTPLPPWVDADAAALLRGLLTVDSNSRVACGGRGISELKAQPFFSGLGWEALHRKEIAAPLCPFPTVRTTAEELRLRRMTSQQEQLKQELTKLEP